MRVLSGFIAVFAAVGAREAEHVRLKQIEVSNAKLPADARPIRIVQISDVHLGLIVRERHLQRILELVESAQPDVLVCTGDLLDSSGVHVRPMAKRLQKLEVPGGKFAVLGNHEYFCGVSESLRALSAAGFQVLRGTNVSINVGSTALCIAGVDDPMGRIFEDEAILDEDRALPPLPNDMFTVLLKHQPVIRPESCGRFDLQLSGHTHGGQITPFQLFLLPFYGRVRGFHRLAGQSLLYISTGAGTWGPPVRLGAAPEVVLITVRSSGQAQLR